MKNFIIIFSFVLAFSVSTLSAKAIHFLKMGDTNDSGIKATIRTDLQNMQKGLTYIASVNQVPLYTKEFVSTKGSLTRNAIDRWIQKTRVASDDIIILYFSGHGDRLYNSPTFCPRGYFSTSGEQVDFSEVIEKLFSKKAALYIALLDCCNSFSKELALEVAEGFKLVNINDKAVVAGSKELFFKLHGLIIASGASPSKSGYIISPKDGIVRGSYFTTLFLKNLFEELQRPNPSWKQLLQQTKIQCNRAEEQITYIPTPQNPKYKIFLHSKRKSPHIYKRYLKRCAPKTATRGIVTGMAQNIIHCRQIQSNDQVRCGSSHF